MILKRFLAAWFSDSAPQPRPQVEALPGFNKLVRGRHGLFIANENDLFIGRSLIQFGEFSELEWVLLRRLCAAGATVVEVGANIGAHTVSLAQAVGPQGRVVAIEPQPEIFRALCANVALNGLANVATLNCGCGEQAQVLRIPSFDYAQEGNFGGVSLKGYEAAAASVPIEVKRLDDLIGPQETVQVIKIDVEGMEAEVIQGSTRILEAYRPMMYVENDRPDKSKALIELIGRLGYRMWWHQPKLFNPDNFFDNHANPFPGIASFNMLCIHSADSPAPAEGLDEVTDSSRHPLAR